MIKARVGQLVVVAVIAAVVSVLAAVVLLCDARVAATFIVGLGLGVIIVFVARRNGEIRRMREYAELARMFEQKVV